MCSKRSSQQVSVVSFTHFGYQKDLKSEPTYRSVRDLADSGLLRSLYVVDVAETKGLNEELFEIPIPGGKAIARAIYLAEDLSPFHIPDARKSIIDIFDRLVARQIGDEKVVHLFPEFGKTARAATEKDITTVVYAAGCHPDHALNLYETEQRRLDTDIRIPRGRLSQQYPTYEHADYVLCLSKYSKETFIENGFNEDQLINVGPLSVDTTKYSPSNEKPEKFTVLMMANLTPLKGIHYLLDAWESLDLENAQLILCGTMNDNVRKILGDRIESLDTVFHRGYVNDTVSQYQEATVLVHPSLTEGFSKTIVEAMACELPVIITDHCQREYIEEAGFVTPIRDPKAIADKIRFLYDNPEIGHKMGKKGRKKVEQNTWDDFSRRIRKTHEEILQREDYV